MKAGIVPVAEGVEGAGVRSVEPFLHVGPD
jgi:hypothetical protein